ncbi:hypothetical protein AGMMS50239_35380 [Bacteroidia bacterium]|nr:hypothetical protein AGMMS50239_35380 [Bacteroidia bacterium]
MIKKQLNRFRKLSIKNRLKTYKSNKWIRSGLLWGAFMYLSTVIFFPLFNGEKITMSAIWIGIPLWVIGGLAFGYTLMNNTINKTDESKENLENE